MAGELSVWERELVVPRRPSAAIGGVVKSRASDFVVTERPLYQPSGDGDHLYLSVRAVGLPHDVMVRRLAELVGLPAGLVRTAGIKDRTAITRQWVSLPTGRTVAPGDLGDGLEILAVSRHGNGLKIGHLTGNRFDLVVRDVASDAADQVQSAIGQLSNRFANGFGPQRFGRELTTLRRGLALLANGGDQSLSKSARRFALNAVQSGVFNATLKDRIEAGTATIVLDGDVIGFPNRGGVFVATDPAAEQLRVDAGETVITGPLPGAKSKRAAGLAATLEAAAVARLGLAPDSLDPFRSFVPGTRRPLIVSPVWHRIEMCDSNLQLSFDLPAGSYATEVVRQFGALPQTDSEKPPT